LVEKMIFVGTGLVLQDESFRMNPCPNSKKDSHKGCPYDNLSWLILSQKGLFQQSLKVVAINHEFSILTNCHEL